MLSYNRILEIIKNNHTWWKISALLFIGSSLTGYMAAVTHLDLWTALLQPFFHHLEQMAGEIMAATDLEGISILFFNNLFASLRVLFLGIILGLPPLLGLVVNGSLLGVVLALLSQEQVSPLLFLLLGVMPHGILEIPAFLLSAGLGLKLGYHLVFPPAGKGRGESVLLVLKETLPMLIPIVFLLGVAAVIEIMVTPRLLGLLVI